MYEPGPSQVSNGTCFAVADADEDADVASVGHKTFELVDFICELFFVFDKFCNLQFFTALSAVSQLSLG